MKYRCYRMKAHNYKFYGGRGIGICDRWRNSFSSFLEDMGPAPTKMHSLDRIDSNGDYEPGNCKWATPQEQSNNTRRNHLITTKPVKKVPISRERIEEAKRYMFSDPQRAVKALRDVRYKLENFERSINHK